MKSILISLTLDGDKVVSIVPIHEVLPDGAPERLSVPDLDRLSRFSLPEKQGRPGRRVVVVAVDRLRHNLYLSPEIPNPSQPVEVGQVFGSIREASQHMGCQSNDVGVGFYATTKTPRVSKVRGVSFMFEDDFSALKP